jgi:hypothetical protein
MEDVPITVAENQVKKEEEVVWEDIPVYGAMDHVKGERR